MVRDQPGLCRISCGSKQGGRCVQHRPRFREFHFIGDVIGTCGWDAFRGGDRGGRRIGRWEGGRATLSVSDQRKQATEMGLPVGLG